MSKSTQVSVLTANRLGDGIVVFLDFEGAWNEDIAEAVVARSPDEVKALEDRGIYDAIRNVIVEPYLVEVREAAGRLTPIRYRERVRVSGPSILDDVPGYSPSSASSPSPHRSSRSEEGVGEGQQQTPEQHPDPLLVKNEERGSREPLTQAA